MTASALPGAAARALLVLLTLGGLALWQGPRMLTPFVPLYWHVSEALLPGHVGHVRLLPERTPAAGATLSRTGDEPAIRLDVQTTRPVRLANGSTIGAGTPLYASTHPSHGILPILVIATVLSAWPAPRTGDRALLLLSGVVTVIAVEALTVPFLLAGTIEAIQADIGGVPVVHSPLSLWYLALNNGGTPVAALFGAIVTIALIRPRPVTG
jgi:hypothetical protein